REVRFATPEGKPGDMFVKEAREAEAPARPGRERVAGGRGWEERRVAAWLGASLVIQGDLSSSEDTTIAGRVEGNVTVRDHNLVIAPGAHVRGDIIARSVEVHGEVIGKITATARVEIGETGSVEG